MARLSRSSFAVIRARAEDDMRAEIERARLDCDSVGGVVECAVTGVPAGAGSPMFGGVENVFSSILFGIPAVKAVEFGDGFACCGRRGSENNDSFYYNESRQVKTRTNHCGGILGGITNGMPILFRVGIKPTASIGKEQDTIDLSRQENAKLVVKGRHDPCIVPRAVPVVEAAAAAATLDLLLERDLYDIRRSTPPDRRHRQPAGSFILPADGLLPGGRQDQGERESSHFQRPAGGGNLNRVAQEAGEYGDAARMLYASIMQASRALQHGALHSGKELRRQIQTAGKPILSEKNRLWPVPAWLAAFPIRRPCGFTLAVRPRFIRYLRMYSPP